MIARKEILTFNNFRPEDSVGYLMARGRARLAKSLDVALAGEEITHAQGSIVLMLATGRYQTAADLARDLYIDSASMTRMIDRLEKRALILRVRDSDDRRVVNLRLTADGQALAARLPEIYASVLARSFAGFSETELETLRGLLRKLLANDTTADDARPVGKSE